MPRGGWSSAESPNRVLTGIVAEWGDALLVVTVFWRD
jgi:hypothetical protein